MPKNNFRNSGPPRNPGVRDLVAEKRKWSAKSPEELGQLGFYGWHERGYLPHRDEPGLTQFVTYHLADSFPVNLRSEWESLLKIEDVEERREQLQAYLDRGHGECILKRPEIAKVVEDSFLCHHGQRYELCAWVVMPNHTHVLFEVSDVSMSQIVGDWKRFTTIALNKLLRRKGPLWMEDYWDIYMRDSKHESVIRHYIEVNPVKAGLVRELTAWRWSSARRRDNYGRLCL